MTAQGLTPLMLPLEQPLSKWTHWTYADEFAELHTKNLIVREVVKGFVPSAGVGTALSRAALDKLAQASDGKPFYIGSLTEDYDCALRLQLLGHKAIFLMQTVTRVIRKPLWWRFGKQGYITIKELIATRALFPTKYWAAVKQKSRWVHGIALQSWANVGWQGGFMTRYFLFHDRKAAITFSIIGCGYVVFIFWLAMYIWAQFNPHILTLAHFLQRDPIVWILIIICTIIMLERMLQRVIATSRIYGFLAGILGIPRIIFHSIITAHVFIRAFVRILIKPSSIKKAKWAKTENHFPTPKQLEKHKLKLGDFLLLHKYVTSHDLKVALDNSLHTKKMLGNILINNKNINQNQLRTALAKEHRLSEITLHSDDILPRDKLPMILDADFNWLLTHGFIPIKIEKNHITLAIFDLEDTKNVPQARACVEPLIAKFVLAKFAKQQ